MTTTTITTCGVHPRRWVSLRSPNSSDVICSSLDDVICSSLDDVIVFDDATADQKSSSSAVAKSRLPSNRSGSSDTIRSPWDFRLASWNILTDNCIAPDQYLYCPSDIRYMDSRHGRIVDELRAIDPDVVCLQEADVDNFRFRLEPDMERMGYHGVSHSTGCGQGLAIFWKASEFEMIKERSRVISDVIGEYLKKNSSVDEETRRSIEEWSNRPEVTSVVQLRHLKTGSDVAVCNNHVGWMKLRRPTLQATQIAVAFRELVDFIDVSVCPLVFCGDFNTPPSFPAYQLLTRGSLDKSTMDKFAEQYDDVIDEVDWKNYDVITKAIPEIFQLPFTIQSAYFTVMGHEPSVTNCDGAHDDGAVRSFCLDYIWYRKLKSIRVLETPTIPVLTESIALPSGKFPSDHVSIATDFVFL